MRFIQQLVRRDDALILHLTDKDGNVLATRVWDGLQPYATELVKDDHGTDYLVLRVPLKVGINVR